MENSNHDFYAVIQLLGKPVTYYPTIAHALGDDVSCSLFLSNFYYWEGKQADPEGWIYKKQSEIRKETGLKRAAQESARKKLRELGIMEEKVMGKPPVLHFRFSWGKLNEVINAHFAGEKVERQQLEDPLLYRLKVIFEEYYEKHSDGITYEWISGRDWKHIKNLSEAFRKRLVERKRKDNAIDPEQISNDEVVNSFMHFLAMLPDYHIQKNLTPAALYSNFSKIIMEIIQKNGNRSSNNQPQQSTAGQYV